MLVIWSSSPPHFFVKFNLLGHAENLACRHLPVPHIHQITCFKDRAKGREGKQAATVIAWKTSIMLGRRTIAASAAAVKGPSLGDIPAFPMIARTFIRNFAISYSGPHLLLDSRAHCILEMSNQRDQDMSMWRSLNHDSMFYGAGYGLRSIYTVVVPQSHSVPSLQQSWPPNAVQSQSKQGVLSVLRSSRTP